jgi:hypothetical protein
MKISPVILISSLLLWTGPITAQMTIRNSVSDSAGSPSFMVDAIPSTGWLSEVRGDAASLLLDEQIVIEAQYVIANGSEDPPPTSCWPRPIIATGQLLAKERASPWNHPVKFHLSKQRRPAICVWSALPMNLSRGNCSRVRRTRWRHSLVFLSLWTGAISQIRLQSRRC